MSATICPTTGHTEQKEARPVDALNQFQRQLKEAIANGLNQTADVILSDIKAHVQVRTGRLQRSYSVTQRATPSNLEIKVDSPLDYKNQHYPPVPEWIPTARNRALQGNPLFRKEDSDYKKVRAIAEAKIKSAIFQQLQQ